jgi:uncharacterized protein (TIGR02246 family)
VTSADAEDRRLLERAVGDWMTAWERVDPQLAVQHYAADADWTNVFGVRCRTRDELETTLTHAFAQPHVMAGVDRLVEQEVRFVNADVALVRTAVERTGQLTASGTPLGTRHTTHLRVFSRTPAGWRIVSHLISDARDSSPPGSV